MFSYKNMIYIPISIALAWLAIKNDLLAIQV